MEKLATVTRVALDKTGTVTEGTPRLVVVGPLPGSGVTADALLTAAAAAEDPSEHPLARAIVAGARAGGLPLHPAADFSSVPGRGVRARIGDTFVEVGRPTPADDERPEVRTAVEEIERAGNTAVAVRIDDRAAGVLGLSDSPREGALDAVAALAALTGSPPVLLTGDNARAAARLADQVGIEVIESGLLPAEKVTAVRNFEAAGDRVLLVGDGVNDAPAMAAAHVSIAMGRGGSDLTLDTADAVTTRDELATLPAVIALARRARRVVVANLVIAATFIAVLVTWDLVGHLPLPLGVAGHEGSTILVALNGLRLLRERAWR